MEKSVGSHKGMGKRTRKKQNVVLRGGLGEDCLVISALRCKSQSIRPLEIGAPNDCCQTIISARAGGQKQRKGSQPVSDSFPRKRG